MRPPMPPPNPTHIVFLYFKKSFKPSVGVRLDGSGRQSYHGNTQPAPASSKGSLRNPSMRALRGLLALALLLIGHGAARLAQGRGFVARAQSLAARREALPRHDACRAKYGNEAASKCSQALRPRLLARHGRLALARRRRRLALGGPGRTRLHARGALAPSATTFKVRPRRALRPALRNDRSTRP